MHSSLVSRLFLATGLVTTGFAMHLDDTPLPLVIWHGLGDSFDAEGIQKVGALAEAANPGTYVYYIRLGDDGNADRSATFFGNVSAQVDSVCGALASHPILSTAPAIDALGLSQGGLFLRAYAQRCASPPIRSLVTFGSPHNGISEFSTCEDSGAVSVLCKGAMALLRFNTWSSLLQSRLVPAQYFRNPEPEAYAKYLESSAFLADVNNERTLKNTLYADNLSKLTNFVMVMFENDTTIVPKETAWFDDVQEGQVIPLRSQLLYKKDWLGLRQLDEKGGLTFRKVPGQHMQLFEEDLYDIMQEFFGPLRIGENRSVWDEL